MSCLQLLTCSCVTALASEHGTQRSHLKRGFLKHSGLLGSMLLCRAGSSWNAHFTSSRYLLSSQKPPQRRFKGRAPCFFMNHGHKLSSCPAICHAEPRRLVDFCEQGHAECWAGISYLGVAQNQSARVTQVFSWFHLSRHRLGTFFEPRPQPFHLEFIVSQGICASANLVASLPHRK